MKKTKKPSPKKKVVVRKKTDTRKVRHEIVVRAVSSNALSVPTESQLMEPLKDGKKMTLQKTWLAENQLLKMLQKTPKEQVYKRKGRGGQIFDYVQGSYCIKWLNFTFGWNWDFDTVQEPTTTEVIQLIQAKLDQVWVTDRLTVRSADGKYSVTKTQTGKADIKFLKNSRNPVSIGDDIKAAHTDALKKCASLLGFASDIYGKVSYKEETGSDPMPSIEQSAPTVLPTEQKEQQTTHQCYGVKGSGCPYGNEEISESEYKYSTKLFKKPLCRECQKDAK